ncbi:cobalamin-independent methionine synthase II family protein [Amycolatopsis sp. DSM 110486]|uniref:cobalamin-independent methionine synthase II family protein n=1 Tax=Amycolatopsis sp. DSM 110486 TaxID=2865832 RepID=UPI002102CA96|nr:cobalamin-independent methionine synthase II family protein [Amycolatopsis sp. DSM 110486]
MIPTEPIGSIPRPTHLAHAVDEFERGLIDRSQLANVHNEAIAATIAMLASTGSPVLTDGEQSKPSFVGYPLAGLENLDPEGAQIPFADGHTRQLPVLTHGPFRYATNAVTYMRAAREYTARPLKQAVIAPSALSLIYPPAGIPDYPRQAFLADLRNEAENDIRLCLDRGASVVQLDFTEARLSLKLDPSGGLLRDMIELNNSVLLRFSPEERARIGVHTCPGADQGATHSADVDYTELLPLLFTMQAGNFYIQLASEPDRAKVLNVIREHSRDEQRIFVGVTDPNSEEIETAEEVRDRVLEAAEYIPVERLGTCDDCGFSPFADDRSMAREVAFAKIKARVDGTRMAEQLLGV